MGMARTKEINFSEWSDEQFYAWLGGFFDGEGCVHLPPIGIDVSIANTNPDVIYAIHTRIGLGKVQRIDPGRVRWSVKYHLRVRKLLEAGELLRRLMPYLTIKKERAIAGLMRSDALRKRRQATQDRNEKIIAMAAKGMFHREIAKIMGVTRSNITIILRPKSE